MGEEGVPAPVSGELSSAPAGSFVFIPGGVRHNWQNTGPVPARILVLFTPAGAMEGFFENFAALDEGADWSEAFKRLGADAGMEVVGPPLAVSDPI